MHIPLEYTYLLVNLGAISVPFLFSFHPRLNFHKQWSAFFPACLASGVLFLIWDYFFTDWGVWGFNPDYLTEIYLANLPLEECLFFLCIPYACVFTYHCFNVLIRKDFFQNHQKAISSILLVLLLCIALLNLDRCYTSVTFILLVIALAYSQFYAKHTWLSRFYFSYLILLIPFFIVNGILTGSGLENPVVWYDNSENIGIRMGTIPFEDTFYGMLLIWITVFIYHRLGGYSPK